MSSTKDESVKIQVKTLDGELLDVVVPKDVRTLTFVLQIAKNGTWVEGETFIPPGQIARIHVSKPEQQESPQRPFKAVGR